VIQRPERYTLGVRQPGMADAEFVQEFRSATYDTFERSNLPPGSSSRERLCVQHLLNALESCFEKGGGEAIGAQAYTPTFASSVFRAAVLWGRLFSYVARTIDSLLPALDESKPFPVEVLQSDEVYANSLFDCLRKTGTKRKHDRSSKRMWSCTDEMFHFTRGIEWFLDMHASVYKTGSQFHDDHKLLVTSIKHLYPSTFHQTWEQCSFEPCAPPPKVRITRPRGSVQWESLRRAHVDYHILFLKGECNRLVGSEPMSRKSRAAPTGAEESDNSDDDHARAQMRAALAGFNRPQKAKEVEDPEDVEKEIRTKWFANQRPQVLAKLDVLFDEEGQDAKFRNPDDETTDVFGATWLEKMISDTREVVEAETRANESNKLVVRKKSIIKSQNVTEDDRLWFQDVFNVGVDKAKAMDNPDAIKTTKLRGAEKRVEDYQDKLNEYTDVKNEVVRLYELLSVRSDPFSEYGFAEEEDFKAFHRSDDTRPKTALLKLINAIEELGNVWNDETQRGIDWLKEQSSETSGIMAAIKSSTSIIDRLYTITFGLTSPTTVTVKDTKFNLFTATPSRNLSERYAATRNAVTEKFTELTNYKSAGNINLFAKPHKLIIDFQAENDELFDKLNQAIVGSGVSARAVQRASNRARKSAANATAKASNSVSNPVPVYFYMGSSKLTETVVDAMPENDREVLMALDSVLSHAKDRGARTIITPEVAPSEKPLQWFKNIGADTGATVNQAWFVDAMDENATIQVSSNPEFLKFKRLSNLIECDGTETNTLYRTGGLSFKEGVWTTETGIMIPKVSRMVFRFPQDAGKVDTTKDAIDAIMQYTYASSQLVGAKVGAIYVFSPDRLSAPKYGNPKKGGWGVMIVMERMDIKILRNETLGLLKSKDPVGYNQYVDTENAYLSRLWVLIARMSAAGIAFMDSHGDNIMAVPSKYGGYAPRLVDFDSRWGCVLSRTQLVPEVLERVESKENKEALRTHPGWRPLYVLNILFVAFQLRIDDSRARVFDQWMSIATSASRDDSKSRSVQQLVNQKGKSKTIDRETHIRILIENELEYLKTGNRDHFNVAHRVLDTKWSGGFWGGVDTVLRPDVAAELKHDAGAAYLRVDDRYMNEPRFEWGQTTHVNPFFPNFLPANHGTFEQLVWGATVKIFENGFKALNSRQSIATVHANMIARQTSVNETNTQSPSEDDTTSLTTSEFMAIAGSMSMPSRTSALGSDTFVKKNASRVFRRLNHFFRQRGDGYNILDLLYEFVMAPPSSLPLPQMMAIGEDGRMLSDHVMQPARRVSDVYAHIASQMKF